MHGKNPKRAPEHGDGQTLKVVEIFPTLQGEGPYAGMPAIFIRLGGCNLACDFCDTEFEQFSEMSLAAIVASTKAITRGHKLVVITGGEPMRQNIAPLCEALLISGYNVQIETNGTIFRALPEGVHIVCSPKAVDGKYYALRPDMLARLNALKFIISTHQDAYRNVADVGQQGSNIPVYIQPMDEGDTEKNAANVKRCVELCQNHGYRLSLQTHKILDIA